MGYLNKSKIELPKNESDYNVWADYIELLTILHPDRSISVESIKDRLIDENNGDIKRALAQIKTVTGRIASPSIDKIAEDQFEDDTDPEDEQRIRTAIIGVIDYMKCRKTVVNDYYPFVIDSRYSTSCNSEFDTRHKIYIILLLSSLIRIINNKDGFAYQVTHLFEQLCAYPFTYLIPQTATIEFFGAGGKANSTDEAVSALFFDKVTRLAEKLCLPLHPQFTRENAGVHNVGDGGLDWVGYLSFSDELSMRPTFFAQCACGNDWEEKLFDANKAKFGQFILFNYDYQLYHFIPKSFRDADNKWLNNIKLHTAILIDRFRIIELLEKTNKGSEIVASYKALFDELAVTVIDFE